MIIDSYSSAVNPWRNHDTTSTTQITSNSLISPPPHALSLEQVTASHLPNTKIKKATDTHPDSTDIVEQKDHYGLLRIGGHIWHALAIVVIGWVWYSV